MIIACIPCLNEEAHIASVLAKTIPRVDRVLVCDDGSSDLTGDIAERMGASVIRHERNMGKGVAVSDLFQAAKNMGATVAVTLDGDGQHDPNEIGALLEPLKRDEADIVIGSRRLGQSMPDGRRAGNRVLTGMTNLASGGSVEDSQSGFRAYSRKALDVVSVAEHGIGVDSQILVDAIRKGLRVLEVPVSVSYGEGTSTYTPARHGLYVIVTLIRVVTERSPLLYLAVPGLVIFLFGVAFMLDLLDNYVRNGFFSIPIGLAGLLGIFVGLILVVAAVLLWSMNNLAVRLRHE